jgi:hypothetical protein
MFSVQYDVEKPNKNAPPQEQNVSINNDNTTSNAKGQNAGSPNNKQQ